jgi:pimeloyl-ACP methyl ester carboxylesterase
VNGEWGFDLEEVKPRIDIWHGEYDLNVPLHAGRYLAERLPYNRTFFLNAEGHFFIISRWEDILIALVSAHLASP